MIPLHSYDEGVLHFHAVDEHARRASTSDSATFESLMQYLRTPIANDPNEVILLARALLVWMGKVLSLESSPGTRDSPIGLVQTVKAGVEHAIIFKMLCGYGNIECKVVVGRTKAKYYQAGDGDSKTMQGQRWNAFKAVDRWHLVHPLWCQETFLNTEIAGNYLIEVDGEKQIRKTVNKDGTLCRGFDDFWFCLNPEIAKSFWFPEEQMWQCLPEEKIATINEFLSVPYLRQGFFCENLKLLRPNSCKVQINNGKCSIVLQAPINQGKCLKFTYKLFADDISRINLETLPLLVLYIPNNPPDIFTFDISMPADGNYRLKIFLHRNSPFTDCCEFKLHCTAADPNCRKLPIDTGIQGWGFGPDAEDAGLRRPSAAGAKIPLKPTTTDKGCALQSIVEFKVDSDAIDDNEYSADILKSSDSAEDTGKFTVDASKFTMVQWMYH